MSTRRPLDRHLTPEEAFHFIENTFSGNQLREIENHLDECPDCVEYLATVVRSGRPATGEEEDELGRLAAPTPRELLERLRPEIVASKPGDVRQ